MEKNEQKNVLKNMYKDMLKREQKTAETSAELSKIEKRLKKEKEGLKKSRTDFYHKALCYFWKKDFDFFVDRLNKLYGKNFKVLSIVTNHTRNFPIMTYEGSDIDRPEYKDNYKTYCLKLLVDEKMCDIVAVKIKKSKVESIKKLFKQENIILLDQGWCCNKYDYRDHDYTSKYYLGGYNEKEPAMFLYNVFAHLDDSRGFWGSVTQEENLYFKNDKRFLTAIFDTIEYMQKNKKEQKDSKMEK